MTNSWQTLRDDAREIWKTGVAAVDSQHLVKQALQLKDQTLWVHDQPIDLSETQRIVVIGAGKAGAGMATGLEAVLLDSTPFEGIVDGWINIPADCTQTLRHIQLHPARPAGLNEPTQAGVQGSAKILDMVQTMNPSDLCICLLSGGGSALLPAPINGISLADKQQVTQFLSAAGANIQQLNTVRKQLSAIKGGRLARACRANRLVTLIISDVPGDPLDIIASGPTVVDSSTPADAIAILDSFKANESDLLNSVYDALHAQLDAPVMELSKAGPDVTNHIIGNNQLAVEAAVQEAQNRGYRCDYEFAVDLEGSAEDVGQQLSRRGIQMKIHGEINCWISGGEPTVQLAPLAQRGRGGRNQQLILAALDDQLRQFTEQETAVPWQGMALLSGGTDGEDGPTDAAGAFLDQQVAELARQQGLHPQSYLDRNDAYSFFDAVQALVKTGPTHTNVCDLRVLLTDST